MRPVTTVKQCAFSARPRPSGSVRGRFATRFGTPAMRPPRRRFVMRWATKISLPPGLRVRGPLGRGDRLRTTRSRRTQTPKQRLGRADPGRAQNRKARHRRTGHQGHRREAFRLTAYRANTPHPHLHQARRHLPCPTCTGGRATLDLGLRGQRRPGVRIGCNTQPIWALLRVVADVHGSSRPHA